YTFPHPDPTKPIEEDVQNLPLRDLWQGWYEARSNTLRDKDGLELLRVWIGLTPQGDQARPSYGENASLVDGMIDFFAGMLNGQQTKIDQLRYKPVIQRLIP